MELRIKKVLADAIIPHRAKPGDSGLDLHAYLPEGPVVIRAGDLESFGTGVAIELPAGHEGQVRSRSGLVRQHGIFACGGVGTVDNGYRGEIGVTLLNHSFRDFTVRHGDRIAQLVVCPVAYPEVIEVEELSETERGASGFGSTGV